VPSFIGNDYFCESGNHTPSTIDGMFFDDTLWDSLGCDGVSTSCEFNKPPWFCKTTNTNQRRYRVKEQSWR